MHTWTPEVPLPVGADLNPCRSMRSKGRVHSSCTFAWIHAYRAASVCTMQLDAENAQRKSHRRCEPPYQGIDVDAIQHELGCTRLQLQEAEAANTALKREMAEAKKAIVAAQSESALQAVMVAAAQSSTERFHLEASDAREALLAAQTELDTL
jgi:hypothetical protein